MKGLEGLLKCSVHNESFNTPKEFYEHRDSVPHQSTGTAKCEDCGCKNCAVDPSELIKGKIPKARCPECEELQDKAVLERMARKQKEKKHD